MELFDRARIACRLRCGDRLFRQPRRPSLLWRQHRSGPDRSELAEPGSKLNELVPNPFYGVITDPLSPLSQPTVQRIQLLRPYPQFTSISASGGPPNGNAIYHAIQFKFTKRYSHGLDVSAHYTFAKMIDDSPANGNVSWLGYDTGGIQSYQNTRLELSLSEYDVRHRVVADFAYQLPVGHGKPFGANMGWADWILGGWQVNGIVTLQSGLPLVPSLANQVLPDATQRPNLLFDPSLTGPITDRLNRYLNPAAFAQPAPYTLGNAPRTLPVRAPTLEECGCIAVQEYLFQQRQ